MEVRNLVLTCSKVVIDLKCILQSAGEAGLIFQRCSRARLAVHEAKIKFVLPAFGPP
jgi:hypothetical protein